MNTFKNAYGLKVVRVGEPAPVMRVDQPEKCVEYWNNVIAKQEWFDEDKEHLVVLLLNTRYDVRGHSMVSVGSLNESIAHPREVFRVAVATGAYAIIMMHNHPSGDPSPSQADHSLTRRLSECAELLQIKLLDHVIVGAPNAAEIGWSTADNMKRRGLYSFKEAGVL